MGLEPTTSELLVRSSNRLSHVLLGGDECRQPGQNRGQAVELRAVNPESVGASHIDRSHVDRHGSRPHIGVEAVSELS